MTVKAESTTITTTPYVVFEGGISMTVGAADNMSPLAYGLRLLLSQLHRRMQGPRKVLLQTRIERQAAYDAGELPQFLPKEGPATQSQWSVSSVPRDLRCRRVEITGPVNSTKMVINMLNRNSAGFRADCAMLDFEDSMKPSWANVMDGVRNAIGATAGELTYTDPKSGKYYELNSDDMAKVMIRVRGLHLNENNFLVDGEPISAGLFDLVTVAWHTAEKQLAEGKTPKFYVPKVESAEEAKWWACLFKKLELALGIPSGSIKATFLIETLPAAFQIEEILYELRNNIVGLNVGRWDKIFSDIKVVRNHPDRIMADRSYINLERDWMANYARRLIRICHLHGAYALGGMAAHTPGRDAEMREQQTQKVAADKAMEAAWGHDGCWVSHPYFIGPAMEAFDKKNQLDVIPDDRYHYPDLLPRAEGPRTLDGLRQNVRVGIAYMHGWQQHIGCIAWDNLMEDLATLEISRASVWQWLHHRVTLDDGTVVTRHLVDGLFDVELEHIVDELGLDAEAPTWRQAAEAARTLFLKEEFQEFLAVDSEALIDAHVG